MHRPPAWPPSPKIWNSHWPFATSALMPSCDSPAARHRSRCASDDFTRDSAHIRMTDAGVVPTLGRRKTAGTRESKRRAVLVEEVLLLEPEPRVRGVRRPGARVARMRCSGPAAAPRTSRARRSPVPHRGTPRRAAACSPSRFPPPAGSSCRRSPRAGAFRASGSCRARELRLAAQARDGLVPVEPDVLQLVVGHHAPSSGPNKKPRIPRVLRLRCLAPTLFRQPLSTLIAAFAGPRQAAIAAIMGPLEADGRPESTAVGSPEGAL